MVLAAVKGCAGIGILIRDAVEAELKDGVLRIFEVPEFRVGANTFATYKRGMLLSRDAQDFLRLASRQIRKLPNRASPLKAA